MIKDIYILGAKSYPFLINFVQKCCKQKLLEITSGCSSIFYSFGLSTFPSFISILHFLVLASFSSNYNDINSNVIWAGVVPGIFRRGADSSNEGAKI